MEKTILAISNATNSSWVHVLSDVLGSSGTLQVASVQEAWAMRRDQSLKLILLDAAGIDKGLADLIEHLRQEHPRTTIVVATTSPTWQRARLVFRAGANDYVRKSLNRDKIQKTLEEFL